MAIVEIKHEKRCSKFKVNVKPKDSMKQLGDSASDTSILFATDQKLPKESRLSFGLYTANSEETFD